MDMSSSNFDSAWRNPHFNSRQVFIVILLLLPNFTISFRNSNFNSVSNSNILGFKILARILPENNVNHNSELTTPQTVAQYGYRIESHTVITDDGYILTMHRIPGKTGDPRSLGQKPVVFLQHGLFGSSFEWLMNKKENILPLKLSDAGYDVWFGNARGNTYSYAHVTKSPKNSDFWEFSFNEMGKYDLPAEIFYVLNYTEVLKLHFVGFSMGTTMFFVMMSHHPEMNAKIKLFTALAPVVYLNNIEGPQRMLHLLESVPTVKKLIQRVTHGEFLPPWATRVYHSYWTRICSNKKVADVFCNRVLFAYAGWDKPQALINQLPLFYSHSPSPMSVRCTMHLLQYFNKGIFEEYDFGKVENIRRYGKPSPPNYKLSRTTVPVALLYGPNDAIVNSKDVARLASDLPNVVLKSPINFQYWNHFDYHLGKESF